MKNVEPFIVLENTNSPGIPFCKTYSTEWNFRLDRIGMIFKDYPASGIKALLLEWQLIILSQRRRILYIDHTSSGQPLRNTDQLDRVLKLLATLNRLVESLHLLYHHRQGSDPNEDSHPLAAIEWLSLKESKYPYRTVQKILDQYPSLMFSGDLWELFEIIQVSEGSHLTDRTALLREFLAVFSLVSVLNEKIG